MATALHSGKLVTIGRTRESIGRNGLRPLPAPELFGSVAHQVHYTPGVPVAYILGCRVHMIGASDSEAEKVH